MTISGGILATAPKSQGRRLGLSLLRRRPSASNLARAAASVAARPTSAAATATSEAWRRWLKACRRIGGEDEAEPGTLALPLTAVERSTGKL